MQSFNTAVQSVLVLQSWRRRVESGAHLDMSGIMLATCSSATGSSRRTCAQLRVYISGDQEHLGTSTRRLVNTTCV